MLPKKRAHTHICTHPKTHSVAGAWQVQGHGFESHRGWEPAACCGGGGFQPKHPRQQSSARKYFTLTRRREGSSIPKVPRDWYGGTPDDMTQGPAAGPYSSPNRYAAGLGELRVKWNWGRPIDLSLSTYTFVMWASATALPCCAPCSASGHTWPTAPATSPSPAAPSRVPRGRGGARWTRDPRSEHSGTSRTSPISSAGGHP